MKPFIQVNSSHSKRFLTPLSTIRYNLRAFRGCFGQFLHNWPVRQSRVDLKLSRLTEGGLLESSINTVEQGVEWEQIWGVTTGCLNCFGIYLSRIVFKQYQISLIEWLPSLKYHYSLIIRKVIGEKLRTRRSKILWSQHTQLHRAAKGNIRSIWAQPGQHIVSIPPLTLDTWIFLCWA